VRRKYFSRYFLLLSFSLPSWRTARSLVRHDRDCGVAKRASIGALCRSYIDDRVRLASDTPLTIACRMLTAI